LGIASPPDIALALGIVGVAVVTLFYDSYYWAQLDLLMFAMGGVLSARLAAIPRPRVVWRSGMYPEQAAPSR
jgi:multisubunit Na+/H+ antiporter MnhB subunit